VEYPTAPSFKIVNFPLLFGQFKAIQPASGSAHLLLLAFGLRSDVIVLAELFSMLSKIQEDAHSGLIDHGLFQQDAIGKFHLNFRK
jgi:hypothetical protein